VVVHPWSGDLPERAWINVREVAVHLDALLEKSKHIVPDCFHWLSGFHLALAQRAYMFQPSLRFSGRHMHWELTAADVISKWCRRVQDQAAVGDQVQTLLHGGLFANQFEVIDVDTENQLEWSVGEQTLPPGQLFEAALQELVREVVSPILPRHGVAVQRQA